MQAHDRGEFTRFLRRYRRSAAYLSLRALERMAPKSAAALVLAFATAQLGFDLASITAMFMIASAWLVIPRRVLSGRAHGERWVI